MLAQIAAFATAVIMMTLLVLSIILMPLAWHFRKTYKKLNHLFDRIHGDIAPILRNAHDIVDNLNYITTSIRTDMGKVNATIDLANDRVQHAVSLTERRLNEFNALLSVVQEEAEGLFVSTASTVRGVRRGAAAFRERGGMDLASDESMRPNRPTISTSRRMVMATTLAPNRPRRRCQRPAQQPRVSVRAREASGGRENEYDLLTAALIGATIGAGTHLHAAARPIRPATDVARRFADSAAARVGRQERRRGSEQLAPVDGQARRAKLWDRIPRDEIREHVSDYVGSAPATRSTSRRVGAEGSPPRHPAPAQAAWRVVRSCVESAGASRRVRASSRARARRHRRHSRTSRTPGRRARTSFSARR